MKINSKQKEFDLIITTIEKVFLNLVNNYKNIKYYRIRCDSNTFKTYLSNSYSLKILELFGFHKEANSNDLVYSLEVSHLTIQQNYLKFKETFANVKKI